MHIWPTAVLALREDSEFGTAPETLSTVYVDASSAGSRKRNYFREWLPENTASGCFASWSDWHASNHRNMNCGVCWLLLLYVVSHNGQHLQFSYSGFHESAATHYIAHKETTDNPLCKQLRAAELLDTCSTVWSSDTQMQICTANIVPPM